MPKSKLRRVMPPRPLVSVVFAALGLLGFVAAHAVCSRVLPEAEWVCVFLLLCILAAVHARIVAAQTTRVDRVIRALKAIAEGGDSWPDGKRDLAAVERLGPDLRAGAEGIRLSVKALRDDKRRAETVLANMSDGIMAVDADGRIDLFNRAAELMMNHRVADVLGRRIQDTDLNPEITRLVDECVTGSVSVDSELKLPGWPQRVISLRATPFSASSARSGSAIVIMHDLTEIRRHEKSQKEFVSNVSHELRTPLTAVRTTAEALLSGAKNDDDLVDRFLTNIIAESDRLSTLIDDVMEIARMDSGIRKTEKLAANVAEMVNRAMSAVKPQAEAKEIAVDIRVPASLVAYCDEMQMTQAIRNLIDNAVKYTHEQGRVEIVGEEMDDSVSISVSDTGIGIPQGEVDRVFERFYRVDKARSRHMGGTGLGLSIVKGIIESHDGKISVETQLGKGSKFTLVLPREGATGPSGGDDVLQDRSHRREGTEG